MVIGSMAFRRSFETLWQTWHEHRPVALIFVVTLVALVYWATHREKKSLGSFFAQPLDVKVEEILPEHSDVAISSSEVVDQLGTEPWSNQSRVATVKAPRRVKGVKNIRQKNTMVSGPGPIQPIMFYFTLGGATRAYAEKLATSLNKLTSNYMLPPKIYNLVEIDYDDFFISGPDFKSSNSVNFYLILVPSYDIDSELSNFLTHLNETHHDFRIDTAPLSNLGGYSVFGFGDRQDWPTEQDGFCSQAVEVDKWMARLTGGKRAFPLGTADVRSDAERGLQDWAAGVQNVMSDFSLGKGLGEGVPGSGNAVESDSERDDEVEDTKTPNRQQNRRPAKKADSADLEDVVFPVDFTTKTQPPTQTAPKPMVPVESPTYASLTKQGYTIVGTHSGVKTCRWTKSALRGRGSCYKYSFYGIASHRCMEATPSLSCSNKCVFCWRHGTNPVGTTWRWQVDDPKMVFDGIKAGHYQKIKMLRGLPGLRSERFAEAMQIRHCALSLVGEPIFYPHINELLTMLHAEHISSFLVCNAQHPEHLAALGPVTQLYVSIDASNKESLRRIDRPLHRDFWERFIRCMDILHEKRFTHRTVFRLTLVKDFNASADDISGYADLVQRALPSFIEVKGVTYCGTSTATGAGLSMQNVPFYQEVTAFILALQTELGNRGLEYGIGAEHAHSCCILLADKNRFYKPSRSDGIPRWHTLIDYPRFFECLESGKPFGPEDYIGEPTPEWALWGKGGFDPRDQRVDRKGKPIGEAKET